MQCAEDGDVVRPLLERPDLADHLLFPWNAFWSLSSDRPPTFSGVSSIPFSAIDRYAARFGVSGSDEFERFEKLIRAMDTAFREKVAEDVKTKGHDGANS